MRIKAFKAVLGTREMLSKCELLPHRYHTGLNSSSGPRHLVSLHTASLSHSPSLSGGTTVNIEDFHSSFNQCRVRTASSNVTGGWWLGNCLAGCV